MSGAWKTTGINRDQACDERTQPREPILAIDVEDPTRRCLVPFTSFAEPVIGGGRGEHWFNIRGRPLAAFAGSWRPTTEGNAFAFLTCEPNKPACLNITGGALVNGTPLQLHECNRSAAQIFFPHGTIQTVDGNAWRLMATIRRTAHSRLPSLHRRNEAATGLLPIAPLRPGLD